ncbi:MAG: peptidylprolyl isomerase [Lacipirellulaceae bacterium]
MSPLRPRFVARCVSPALLATALAAPTWSAGEATTGGAVTESVADVTADPVAAFKAAVADYKAEMRKFEALGAEFQTADEARREAINKEVTTLVAATQPKVDAMVDAALQAYQAAPEADSEVTDVLTSVVRHQMVGRGARGGGGDQYEAALPTLTALVEGGNKLKELPVWGVLAAIATGDFDAADRFAAAAKKAGSLAHDPGEDEPTQNVWSTALDFMSRKDSLRKQWDAEAKVRAAEAAADDLPRVKLTTSKGEIVIELFENEAPTATANFVTLAKKGFYDGVVFHRVLPQFMAQGGDPTGKGSGGPGYSIACECDRKDARKHFRGTLSMAHAGKNTGGSQFFLTFLPTAHLDGGHTVFGRVIEGWDVLGQLQRIDPDSRGGAQPDKIVKAEVLRDRGHGYEFKKLPGR